MGYNKNMVLLLAIVIFLLSITGCTRNESQEKVKLDNSESAKKHNEAASNTYENIHINNYNDIVKLYNSGKKKEAEEKIKEMVKEYDEGIYEMAQGYILFKEKNYEEALIKYEKAVEKDPNLEEAYKNMVSILILKKDFERALTAIEEGLNRFPENTDLIFNKGQILYVQEKYEEAIKEFQSLVAKGYHYDAYRLVGLSYMKVNDKENAIENLNLFISKAPDEDPIKEKIIELVDSMKSE